ncbi:MAG: hypothetical protein JJU28_05665 [Cyclobacteriaceae bacterium]|nr:hypothetical protein [Cyclobacteriaceae bacterium]
MITCVKATELIEKRQIQSLTLGERFKLRLHNSMCVACRAYQRQSKTIEKAISRWMHITNNTTHHLSQEKKDKIIEELKKL